MLRTSSYLLMFAALLAGAPAFAHPMGNFSINHYTRLKVERQAVDVLYIIDMAEIPAFQEIQQNGLSPESTKTGLETYARAESTVLARGLSLQVDGHPVALNPVARAASFAPGAGGLPTLRIQLRFRAKLSGFLPHDELAYADDNFPNRAGWKEIVVQSGDGVTIERSSVSAQDRSSELKVYAPDLLTAPPQDLTAAAAFTREAPVISAAPETPRAVSAQAPRAGTASASIAAAPVKKPAAAALSTGAVAPQTRAASSPSTPRSAFTQLITSQAPLGFFFLLSAALIAAALGALHALEPGHGKTIVASYLVGSHGSARHAILLGAIVTVSHTAGVFALGLITLYAAQYIVPDRLYPILGAISGFSVVAVGTLIFIRTLSGESGDHSHTPGESHSHWLQSLTKTTTAPARSSSRPISLRQLFILGVTGGIIPCPGALVVLLSAFSLHRIGFGLFLIVAFSAGLAAVLISIGLLVVYAKRLAVSRFRIPGAFSRYLPLGSSVFMAIAGCAIVYSSLQPLMAHWSGISREHLVPFLAVVLLGLFLGMRHSTDSDHVVAVSTLVTRQGSIRSSVSIGLLWGLGHTITIFLVGTAIIVFGFVIPPRLGLSMEFAVALMLVLLGILNLTGALGKITARFSAAPNSIAAGALSAKPGKLGLFHSIRPLFIGLVHGLAGSAAVALLVLSTIRNPFWACGYLLVFGFGTMLGMMLMTCAISLPLVYAQAKSARITSYLTTLSGFASLSFGLFLVFQIGFVDGLFRSQVHWIAH